MWADIIYKIWNRIAFCSKLTRDYIKMSLKISYRWSIRVICWSRVTRRLWMFRSKGQFLRSFWLGSSSCRKWLSSANPRTGECNRFWKWKGSAVGTGRTNRRENAGFSIPILRNTRPKSPNFFRNSWKGRWRNTRKGSRQDWSN